MALNTTKTLRICVTNDGVIEVRVDKQFTDDTDRATGALLYLGQTGSVGSLSVLLVPWDGTIRQPATVFGPQDGPYLNGHARLYSQNGTLAVEDTSPPAGIYDHRVFTRDGAFGRHLLEITLTEPLTLTYTEINT
jgi:hypothetical protein